MGVQIDALPHSCGTRQGLKVFADEDTGKVNSYCFSCNTFVPNPYGEPRTIDEIDLPEPKSPEEVAALMAEVSGYPTVSVRERKLRADSLDYFGVKTSLNESDGKTPTAMYFPITKKGKVTGYYAKTLGEDKIEWSIGDTRDGDLFGWDQAIKSGAYKLIITEGLADAVAAHKINELYGKPEYMPAIVSLTNGTNSVGKALSRQADEIKRRFKEVILCFDDDEPGRRAVEKAMLSLPSAKSVKLPAKDANDCLIKGYGKAAYKAMAFEAQTPKNTRLLLGSDIHLAAREPAKYGELTWPWEKFQRLMRGVRLGETIYIGAGVKMGKSEIGYALAAHFISQDGVKVFGAWPEEGENDAYKKVAGHIVGREFCDPDVPFDEQAYDRAGEIMGDSFIALDLYQHMGWETLKGDIVSAVNLGAKVVMIDPITNLTAGMSPTDVNTFLQGMSRDISAMAKDMGFVCFLFCHLKGPDGNIEKDTRRRKYEQGEFVRLGNCAHERGGDVHSIQFVGSRAMMQSCQLMLGLEGNKDDELPEDIRATRWLSILEDRKFNNSDSVRLFRNKNSTQFKEVG